ncbi:MAG: signal-transduction protein with cAMP-binding, CBS, and nucleotidyltransferase domain [Halioglobus sp.]|jgi:signal-transduction protein with cAMP-binding, CBS, and nucleotidyltransferase domain
MKLLSVEQFKLVMDPSELSAGSIFGALRPEATQFLLEEGKIFEVITGDPVYTYGDRGDRFYVVCSGAINFLKYHKGAFHKVRTATFGQEVGFVAMIDLHKEGGSAIAMENSIVLQITSDLFHELHRTFPTDFGLMTLNLARDMARVISKLGERLIDQSLP